MPGNGLDERVIICVESAYDAERIVNLLASLDINGVSCPDYVAASDQVSQGAAAVILSGSPTILQRSSEILSVFHAQPAWSAIPIIFIVEESATAAMFLEDIPLGVTFLERPIRVNTLTSVARLALNARRNQYTVRNLLQERERLVDQLRAEAKMKNEFLATLAHELRNPLAPVRTGLRILRISPPGEPTTQILEMMDRQVCHLVRLIDDLLDISRITCGKLELRKQRVSLQSLLSDAVETSRPLIDAGNHTLTVSAPDESILLEVDPIRLAQVISNLLNNAAKYTPHGGNITLTARGTDDTVQIEVRDDGIGLSPEMLTKIFTMFSQVSSADLHSQGGLGIGLALARRLTEMHGGTVDAASAGPGKGSSFTVTLPCMTKGRVETQ
jgi:signal transduction histidine kinase